MALSYEELRKQIDEANKSQLKTAKTALKNNATNAINLINKQAEDTIAAQEEAYKTDAAEVRKNYEDAFQRNEVQKLLNERHIERKAAEIGLTDSGMNRTQLTANQLSHANQQGKLDVAMQKDINTLAAAMRAKISEAQMTRDSKVADINANLNTGLSDLETNYAQNIDKQASEIYKNQYGGGNINYKYDNQGNVVGGYSDSEKEAAWSNLEKYVASGASGEEKTAEIFKFILNYDISETELGPLLEAAKVSEEELDFYSKNESLRISPKEYNKKYMAGDTGNYYVDPSDWNYKTNGKLRYNFVVNRNRTNWWWGVDGDDVVSIYYPDNTPVKGAQNIKIEDLPASIQKEITKRTKGTDDGDKFYFSCNLEDLRKEDTKK